MVLVWVQGFDIGNFIYYISHSRQCTLVPLLLFIAPGVFFLNSNISSHSLMNNAQFMGGTAVLNKPVEKQKKGSYLE